VSQPDSQRRQQEGEQNRERKRHVNDARKVKACHHDRHSQQDCYIPIGGRPILVIGARIQNLAKSE